MLSKTFIGVALFASLAAAQSGMKEIPLWTGGAPGSAARAGEPEKIEPRNPNADFLRVSNIHNPSLTVFLPPDGKGNGAAMIVAPGGGHRLLAIEHEGYAVAKYLNSIGVAAFVLKYRLAREPNSPYKVEVEALADANRAVRTVRSRAAEWKVDPSRIGFMGFSAGGELTALAATRFDRGKANAADPIERVSSRPDFHALIYPGKGAETVTVSPETSPVFMLCADNDRNPATAISSLYSQYKIAGVPAELHIYGSGGHGFGIRPGTHKEPVMDTWFLRLGDWMKDRGLLGK